MPKRRLIKPSKRLTAKARKLAQTKRAWVKADRSFKKELGLHLIEIKKWGRKLYRKKNDKYVPLKWRRPIKLPTKWMYGAVK